MQRQDLAYLYRLVKAVKQTTMLSVNPQYIKDANGNKSLVVLTAVEFDTIMEELDEQEDIKRYELAKADDGPSIPIDEAFRMIEAERKS